MGRKSYLDLNPDIKGELLKIIGAGNHIETACDYVGIDVGTYMRWIRLGKEYEAQDEEERNPDNKKYLLFYKEAQKARAACLSANLANIQIAGKTQWQASAWYLERMKPEKFAKIDRIQAEINGKIQHNHTIDLSKLSEAELIALDAIMSKAGNNDDDNDLTDPES